MERSWTKSYWCYICYLETFLDSYKIKVKEIFKYWCYICYLDTFLASSKIKMKNLFIYWCYICYWETFLDSHKIKVKDFFKYWYYICYSETFLASYKIRAKLFFKCCGNIFIQKLRNTCLTKSSIANFCAIYMRSFGQILPSKLWIIALVRDSFQNKLAKQASA